MNWSQGNSDWTISVFAFEMLQAHEQEKKGVDVKTVSKFIFKVRSRSIAIEEDLSVKFVECQDMRHANIINIAAQKFLGHKRSSSINPEIVMICMFAKAVVFVYVDSPQTVLTNLGLQVLAGEDQQHFLPSET